MDLTYKNVTMIVSPGKMAEKLPGVGNLLNPGPPDPRYALPLQTVLIQISWLLKKPTDLELHCLSLSV